MAIIEVVKWDGNPNILAWKFPSTNLATSSQLIVNESQEAFLVNGGVYEGPFLAGRHTLTTQNLPVLRDLMKLPFGGDTPFSAEVWYVNKAVNLSLPWGTPDPIQLEDPKYQVMIPVRAFGQYGVQVKDSKKFLLKLVGTLRGFDVDTLQNYFAGVFTTTIKQLIAATIIETKVSVLEIAPHLDKLSQQLLISLAPALDEYGLALSQFNINSINVPEEDPAVIQLKAALAKRAELGILGFTYQQDRSFDVLETAAGNEGSAGTVLGAGLGLGLGVGIGGTVGQMAAPGGVMNTNAAPANQAAAEPTATEKIELLKQLAELKNSGVLTEEEFTEAKRKLLA